MRYSTNRSRTSMTIALSLALLAVTLGGPALAADAKDSGRGAKGTVVTQPAHVTLPIGVRPEVIDRQASLSPDKWMVGPWHHTLPRLLWTLHAGFQF
jgi:hypothetical protein